ncbi:hypothetical protein FRB99_005468 [Tulasnella sp. 403]|nr:hypothetical protein FRB99_005468 [Tulasnella sp. 403]
MTSTKAIASSTFSPSGRFFALSDTSHNVQLWDLNSESLCKTFTGQVASVMGIDISSDDTFVASAASNGVIRVWYFGGEEQKPVVLKTDFRDSPSAIAISPECDLVVAGTNRGGVHIWDIKTKSLTTTLPGRNFVAVRFSPDGSWLLGANTGGEVKRWDVPAIRQKKTDVPCSVAHLKDEQAGYSPSISQDNTWTVALSTAEGEVHMIRFGEGEPKPTVIGNVPAAATGRRVSSGPVSNKATGLVVGFARDGGRAIVYKYASWDYAGAYLV